MSKTSTFSMLHACKYSLPWGSKVILHLHSLCPPPSLSISNKKSFSFALQFVALSLHTVQVIRAFKYQPSIQDFESMKFESDLSCDQLPKVGTYLLISSGKKNSAIHLLYFSKSKPVHDLPFVCQDSHPCCDFD